MKKETERDFDPVLEEKLAAFQTASPFDTSPRLRKAKKSLDRYINKKLRKKKSS